MAHTPETRAKAISEVASGDTYDAVSTKHGISKRTLINWVQEARTAPELHQIAPNDARQLRFTKALDEFLFSTIKMVHAWAEKCSDPHFIQHDPQGVNELGKTVLERADRMVSILEGRE